jgi:tetratricopeptide (TPR) repeat protein
MSSDTTKLVLADINKKIEKDPENADLYNNRARYYMFESQFDLALKDINKTITLSPNNPAYYLTLSDVYLVMGKPTNCGDALKKALSLDPKNNPALLRMAKLNLIIKEYKTSMEFIRKALDVEPVNPQAYFTKALVLLETGDTVKAVEDLKKAVDQKQEYFEALMELGELYSMKKDQMAADYFKNALKIKPDSKEALYMLGMFYQESGQYENAIKTYTSLSLIDTTFRNAPYNMGYIYLVYMKDVKKAIVYFTKALQKDPGYFEAYYNRGFAYELDGQYKNASLDYQKTLAIKTNYEKAIDGLNRLDKFKRKN